VSEVFEWAVTAAGNNDTPPDGAPEDADGGVDPAEINNIQREIMAATRRWYDNPEYLNLSDAFVVSRTSTTAVRIAGVDQTTIFAVGTRVRLAGGAAPQFAYVASSAFAAGNTDLGVDVVGGAAVDVATDEIRVHLARTARSAAFAPIGTTTGTVPLVENIRTLATRTPLYGKKTSVDQSITGSGVATQITLTGTPATDYIQLTVADGAKDFLLSVTVGLEKISTGLVDYTFQVHVGALGTTADAVAFSIPVESLSDAGAKTSLGFANVIIANPPASRRISFSFLRNAVVGVSGWKVYGSGTVPQQFMYATVEEAF
jgi:hypothetical protein